jgi:hypothetical protein
LLRTVQPSYGVGVDEHFFQSNKEHSQSKELQFHPSLKDVDPTISFDYIILSSVTMEVDDIQDFLSELHPFCTADTRLVIDTYSYLWEPLLWVGQQTGFRRPTELKHWLSQKDIVNLLNLSNFELVTKGSQILMPFKVPGISYLFNNLVAQLPLINRLCLNKWIIARPCPKSRDAQDFTVSVVIPCRNERGNVELAIQQCPLMGKHTEFIFVEGHSKDDTLQEMYRVKEKYSDRDITILQQDGKGKGDAMRKGFAHAKGDVLIILDGDITTPPEEMPKFFNALIAGKGDFINGSRLIYGMESEAMRFLNLFANYGFGIGFSWLLGQPIKDTLCGTKVLFRHNYQKIVKNRSFFGDFDPFGDFDLLFGAAKQNLKIVDMPVHYKNRIYGTTQISRFSAGFLLLRMSFVAWKKFKFR